MKAKLPPPEEHHESPSIDSSDRFPLDQRFRALGYTIASRPGKGPDTWQRNGKTFTVDEVIKRERMVVDEERGLFLEEQP